MHDLMVITCDANNGQHCTRLVISFIIFTNKLSAVGDVW